MCGFVGEVCCVVEEVMIRFVKYLHDKNKKIDKESTGIACVSFGVPFMIFASDLVECEDKDLVLAPKDIHENIDIASKIIAGAISGALGLEE